MTTIYVELMRNLPQDTTQHQASFKSNSCFPGPDNKLVSLL